MQIIYNWIVFNAENQTVLKLLKNIAKKKKKLVNINSYFSNKYTVLLLFC